jgi:hypothetical protein
MWRIMPMTKREWIKPTVVQKAVEETQAGRGTTNDGLVELQS